MAFINSDPGYANFTVGEPSPSVVLARSAPGYANFTVGEPTAPDPTALYGPSAPGYANFTVGQPAGAAGASAPGYVNFTVGQPVTHRRWTFTLAGVKKALLERLPPAANQQGTIYAGALPLGEATYPIPTTNVIYLSMSGNDNNNGLTENAPKATLQAAVTAVPTGGTIVARGGVYPMAVIGDVLKAITIQAYPGEAVWFDGSDVVTAWTNNGDGTWSADLVAQFPHPGDATRYTNTSSPMGMWPDGVWVDGFRLFHRPNTEVPSATQFTVDYSTNRVRIGTNPTGKQLRLTARERWMVIKAPMKILGIGIRRYADNLNTGGMATSVQASGGTVFENCHFVDASFNACAVNGTGSTIRYCTIVRAGYTGIGSNQVWDSTIENTLILDANWKKLNQAPSSGTIKLARSTRGIIRHCYLDSNDTVAVWYDVSCFDNWGYNNTVAQGTHGFFYEISRRAVFFSNRILSIVGPKSMEVCDSSEVRMYNNEITRAQSFDVWIHTDLRHGVVSAGENPDGVQNWDCVSPTGVGSEVVNNVYTNRNGYAGVWRTYMQGDANTPADDYIDAFRSNAITTQTSTSSTTSVARMYAIDLATGANPGLYQSVTEVEQAFPAIASGNFVTQKQAPTQDDYDLWTSQNRGAVIPNDICDKVGIPRGTAAVGPVFPAPVPRTPDYL